jgi:hypothetical protein
VTDWFNQFAGGLAMAIVLIGCGPSGPEAVMKLGAAPLDVRAVPWPSDALLGPDGRLLVQRPFPFDASIEDNLDRLAATLSELDGFGTTSSIFFPVSDDVTVQPGATATIVDLDDPTVPPRTFPLFYRADTKQLVAMAPFGTALLERRAYGCWIDAGVNVHPSADMQTAIDGGGPASGQGAWPKLAARLKQEMVKPIAATAFTTQTLTGWVPKILGDLSSMPPKAHVTRVFHSSADLQLVFGGPVTTTRPGKPPSGGVKHDSVAFVIEGTYDVPHYLSATPGTLGTFDDALTVKAIDHVPFLLALPVASSYASTPVVIFQHGINDDRKAVLEVCNSFTAQGLAVLGIDELWHGSRLPMNVDQVINLSPSVMQPDGIGDPQSGGAIQWFFDLRGDPAHNVGSLDPRYMRDNFRQAVVDLMQEVRLAEGGDFSEVAAADPALNGLTIDGSRLVYSGESFGSILGAQVLAVDPMLRAAVLDVGGGGIVIDLVGRSAQFAQLLQPFVAGGFDLAVDVNSPDTLPLHAQMSLNVLETAIEPGDGLALSSSADPTKHVLFLEAYSDETVPNSSTEALAAGWGVTQVTTSKLSHPTEVVMFPTAPAPYSASSVHALVELDPATHPMFTVQNGQRAYVPGFPPFMKLPMPMPVDNPIEQVHALAIGFAQTLRATGTPTVPDTP